MSFKYRDNPLYYRAAREALRLEQSGESLGSESLGSEGLGKSQPRITSRTESGME